MPYKDRFSRDVVSKQSKRLRTLLIVASLVLLAALLVVYSTVQRNTNRTHAFETSSVVISHVERVIENNEQKEATLTASLKEDYTTRAKAISYILDRSPQIVENVSELKRIASLMEVDEIHLFDDKGKIFAGTVPRYFGYSFDSGDQIAYFMPMLKDKTLTMCQDVTPNTAEGKEIMYAICWNDAGSRMTQVGIEPVRLLEELRSNEIAEIVSTMPSYAGLDIFVADAKTGEIEGSTHSRLAGKKLSDMGISTPDASSIAIIDFESNVDGKPSYCAAHETNGRLIVVSQAIDAINDGLLRSIILLALFYVVTVIIFSVIVERLTLAVSKEHLIANTDSMTGFLNRRAYEDTLADTRAIVGEDSLVFVSMDLNGLKATNDTLGHAAGDELIKGAAATMKRCFGSYGSLYRIGGDEFVAIIHANDAMLDAILHDFDEAQATWTAEHTMELSISYGCAAIRNHPGATLSEIAKIADEAMYQAKHEHHEN